MLLDLSQSATLKASEDMAGQVLDGLKRLGKTHKGESNAPTSWCCARPTCPRCWSRPRSSPIRTKSAASTIPATSALARAILDGVNAYFTRQPPPGTLYAARAEPAAMGGGSRQSADR